MDYISEIASNLLAHSFCVPILGPEIYTMIADWEKKGIPLGVVINSVKEYCGRPNRKKIPAESAEGLSSLVTSNFLIWLQERQPEQQAN